MGRRQDASWGTVAPVGRELPVVGPLLGDHHGREVRRVAATPGVGHAVEAPADHLSTRRTRRRPEPADPAVEPYQPWVLDQAMARKPPRSAPAALPESWPADAALPHIGRLGSRDEFRRRPSNDLTRPRHLRAPGRPRHHRLPRPPRISRRGQGRTRPQPPQAAKPAPVGPTALASRPSARSSMSSPTSIGGPPSLRRSAGKRPARAICVATFMPTWPPPAPPDPPSDVLRWRHELEEF